MKCLIMSHVIFCTAQDVTGVRKERRERDEEGEEYRENNGFDRDSGSLNKKKRERKQRSEEALITDAALEQHQLYSAHNYLSF